jgi:hypothetical protein
VGGNPVSYVDPTGEYGLPGAAAGAGFELAVQAYKNYKKGCDLLNWRNYDWGDVGISAGIGAVAPGWLAAGKSSGSIPAIVNLARQLGRAQTGARATKIAGRIEDHVRGIADVVVPQVGWQGIKEIGKEVTDAGGANDCTCSR